MDLAKNVKDEQVFQQEHRYKKFKAKNHIIQTHELNLNIWGNFFGELLELKFHRECIYWCTKILEDVRLCDSSERSYAIYVLVASHHSLDDFENREVDSIKIAMAKYQTHFKYLFDRYCAMSSDKISLSH